MFNNIISSFLAALLLTFSFLFSANAAEDLVEQWYMQPRLNLQSDDTSNLLFDHQSLNIGQALSSRINLEISLLSDKPERQSFNRSIVIDGRYYLTQSGRFSPYIAGGIARQKNNRLNSNYEDPTTNIGLGFEHTLRGNGTKFKADIRYFLDNPQRNELDRTESNDWTLSLGVSIPLSMDLFK